MRIVYLHQYFRTPQMAGGIRSYEFARRLVERGHEVHVVTADSRPAAARPRWRVSTEVGVSVHWAGVPYDNSMSFRRRIVAFVHFAWVAARRAAAIRPDLVLATSTPLTIAVPAIYAARRRQVPMVLEVRDLWPEVPIAMGALRSPLSRMLAWRLERVAYAGAAAIIALTPTIAGGIRARFPAARITVVSNGCDGEVFADAERAGAEFRRRHDWAGTRPLILYAGTLGLVNGVEYSVRMAAALRDRLPEARFAIVGEGVRKAGVRRLAEELGVLGHNLFLFDQVPKLEIVGFFGACDLALSTVAAHPVLALDSANKVFDALAAGRPVGVNHDGWLADLLRASGAGLVLPQDDPARAAVLVADFLADGPRQLAARAAATRLAQEDFARDRLFARFEEVLSWAAACGLRTDQTGVDGRAVAAETMWWQRSPRRSDDSGRTADLSR